MRPAFLAVAVTLSTLAIIWLLAPRSPIAAWILGTLLAVFVLLYTRPADLGFGWEKLQDAVMEWWWAYGLCLMAFAALVQWRAANGAVAIRGVAYLAGCAVQQLIYQHLVCAPLTKEFGGAAKSQWTSALLFSLVHLPNPVLMAATLIWGAAAWSLFRRTRSLWAVAIFQYFLSGILYALLPYAWHHAFRVGPRYFS